MPTTVFRICLLLILMTFHSGGYAASAHEREQLSLVQQQVDTIERLAAQAEVASDLRTKRTLSLRLSPPVSGHPTHSPRNAELLSPSRAQPHDAGELVGDYRPRHPVRGTVAMSMTDAQTAALPKRLRFLGTEQFDTLVVPCSRPGFALVHLGDEDGLPGLGHRQCALRRVWRQRRTCFARPTSPDVLHAVLIQEITAMLRCFAPLKKQPA